MAGRKRISAEQLAALRACFLRGDKYATAQVAANVSSATVMREFIRFRAQGLERGPRPMRGRLPGAGLTRNPKYPRWSCPRYDGPDWIGKAVDTESRI